MAKVECFSVEDNGLLKVPSRSQLAVTKPEMNCEPSQRDRLLGVARWAKFQCFAIKVDRLLDITGPPSLLKLGNERLKQPKKPVEVSLGNPSKGMITCQSDCQGD